MLSLEQMYAKAYKHNFLQYEKVLIEDGKHLDTLHTQYNVAYSALVDNVEALKEKFLIDNDNLLKELNATSNRIENNIDYICSEFETVQQHIALVFTLHRFMLMNTKFPIKLNSLEKHLGVKYTVNEIKEIWNTYRYLLEGTPQNKLVYMDYRIEHLTQTK